MIWHIYKINDSDWVIAQNKKQIIEWAEKEYGDNYDEYIDFPVKLTEKELKNHRFYVGDYICECGAKLSEACGDELASWRCAGNYYEHHHGYPLGHVGPIYNYISFEQQLKNRINNNPEVGLFASTEF